MPRFLTDDEVEEFRDQLVDAAIRIFSKMGVDGITMRGLASEVGCSRQTPYRYFESKEDILSAVRAAGFSRLASLTQRAMTRVEDPVQRIAAAGKAYVRYAASNPELYRLMWSYGKDEPKTHPELYRQLMSNLSNLTECFRAAVDAGRIAGDPRRLNVVFWSGLHGIVMLELHASGPFGRAFESVAAEVISTLLAGMNPPKTARRNPR